MSNRHNETRVKMIIIIIINLSKFKTTYTLYTKPVSKKRHLLKFTLSEFYFSQIQPLPWLDSMKAEKSNVILRHMVYMIQYLSMDVRF